MALIGHVTPEITLRYAKLASPTIRAAYQSATDTLRGRQALPIIAIGGAPVIPDRIEWLHAEMLKTRLAHGYCSRPQAAGACPYADICEQCDNFVPAPDATQVLSVQLDDIHALRADAQARGWGDEAARHTRVPEALQTRLNRLRRHLELGPADSDLEGRLIAILWKSINARRSRGTLPAACPRSRARRRRRRVTSSATKSRCNIDASDATEVAIRKCANDSRTRCEHRSSDVWKPTAKGERSQNLPNDASSATPLTFRLVPKVCLSWCGVTWSGLPSRPRSPAASTARLRPVRSRNAVGRVPWSRNRNSVGRSWRGCGMAR